MIKIGICEDETPWRIHIEKTINKYLINLGEPFLLKTYSGGEELLCAFEYFDILFLDIEMPGMDGIETAKRIRKVDGKVEIVFLTSHEEMMREAFQVKAYRFLDKEFRSEGIDGCLEMYSKFKLLFIINLRFLKKN